MHQGEMPLKLEGASGPGSIMIQSRSFRSTAVRTREGIRRTVVPLQLIAARPAWYRHPLVPRIGEFLLGVIGTLTRAQILIVLGLVGTYHLIIRISPATGAELDPGDMLLINGCLLAIAHLINFFTVARWHAAEHMAIGAYEQTGRTDLESIRQQSRVDVHCGTRFVAPMGASLLLACVAQWAGASPLIPFLLGFELFLRLDERWGLDRIPLFREASVFLQRYVTTREPDDGQLEVARHALEGLLAAHRGVPKS